MISVRNLCKKYGDNLVLKDVTWHVSRQEVMAIMGPSGSGKTTLLRLVDLLEKPTSGTVSFDGVDVSASGKMRLELRRRTAIVLQKPVVFSSSVYENVAYGLKVRGERTKDVREKVSHALATVGLSGYENRRAKTLSGGEVQRVALARAMVIQPELLLLDEPFSALDAEMRRELRRDMQARLRQWPIPVILATHDRDDVLALAHRVVVLDRGRVVAEGDPLTVLGRPMAPTVASLAGMENLLEGVVETLHPQEGTMTCRVGETPLEAPGTPLAVGETVQLGLRAADVLVAVKLPEGISARNVLPGYVVAVETLGHEREVHLDCGFPLRARLTPGAVASLELAPGRRVWAVVKASALVVMEGGGA